MSNFEYDIFCCYRWNLQCIHTTSVRIDSSSFVMCVHLNVIMEQYSQFFACFAIYLFCQRRLCIRYLCKNNCFAKSPETVSFSVFVVHFYRMAPCTIATQNHFTFITCHNVAKMDFVTFLFSVGFFVPCR